MKLNTETMVHGSMYNVKYRQPDTSYKPVFEPLKQIQAIHSKFKVTGFVDLGLHLKSLYSLEKYIKQLEEQMMDIVRNPHHKFMEQNISTVIDRTPPLGVGVSAYQSALPISCYVYVNS